MSGGKVLLILLIVVVSGYAYFVREADSSTSLRSPTPTSLQLPPPPYDNRPLYFPESILDSLEYGPDLYPEFAEANSDAPCATWENGGLTWLFFHMPADLGWVVEVAQPDYRFCGISVPHPAKPMLEPMKLTPYGGRPTPNRAGIWERSTATPEPTSSP